jgi:DNA-binding transcriptional ArsR family regulator
MDKARTSKEIVGSSERRLDDFVLDKDIFSNIFNKDIRRVYIYKKAERLAKAIHLVTPAFASSPSLKERIDGIAMALVDAAILPPALARDALSRELLTLSSLLAVARTGSLLSPMNADIIAREAQLLLQELAGYEEPRVTLADSPTLAGLAREARLETPSARPLSARPRPAEAAKGHIGHISDKPKNQAKNTDRREAILAVISTKKQVYIKDVSTLIRGVSEKTIQRELQALVKEGILTRQGERRWTLYSLA